MRDFTELSHTFVPPDIVTLRETNTTLENKNKLLRNVLIIVAIGGVIIITYHIYQNYKAKEKDKAS